jgi:hypothetical protein
MKSKTILFRDPVVERVCDKFVKRSDVGYAKYGKTLHEERTGKHKDLTGYLNDIQEELMDAILYIQAAREELAEDDRENILGVNSPLPESFRPPHPSHAEMYEISDTLVGGMTGDKEKGLVNAQKKWDSTAQQDWDDHVAPV